MTWLWWVLGVYGVGLLVCWGHIILDRWESNYVVAPSVWKELLGALGYPFFLLANSKWGRQWRRRRRARNAASPNRITPRTARR